MFRALIYVLIAIFLITVVRMFLGIVLKGFGEALRENASGGASQRPKPSSTAASGELKRDPVCGTFVPVSTSLRKQIGGDVHYFCSPECRDRYSAG
jgi:YHS domain-containing protein